MADEPTSGPLKVFVSNSRIDIHFAEQLVLALEDRRIQPLLILSGHGGYAQRDVLTGVAESHLVRRRPNSAGTARIWTVPPQRS
jgi:hypothetical protein